MLGNIDKIKKCLNEGQNGENCRYIVEDEDEITFFVLQSGPEACTVLKECPT
jgi:hypothetical protein